MKNWVISILKRILSRLEEPRPESPSQGVDIFATDGNPGEHGASCDSPCSFPIAFGIAGFLSRMYPDRRNRILCMSGSLVINEPGTTIENCRFSEGGNGETIIEL